MARRRLSVETEPICSACTLDTQCVACFLDSQYLTQLERERQLTLEGYDETADDSF